MLDVRDEWMMVLSRCCVLWVLERKSIYLFSCSHLCKVFPYLCLKFWR